MPQGVKGLSPCLMLMLLACCKRHHEQGCVVCAVRHERADGPAVACLGCLGCALVRRLAQQWRLLGCECMRFGASACIGSPAWSGAATPDRCKERSCFTGLLSEPCRQQSKHFNLHKK